MSASTQTWRFFSSYTGRMLLGMLAIHTILVPLVFVGVLLILQHDYQSQFVNNARSQSYLLASLISENPEPARVKSIINDQLLAGQVLLAEFKNADDSTNDNFREDFFFGQGGDKIYHIIVPVRGSNNQLVGKLRVGFDETPVEEHIKQTYRWGLLVVLGFIVVSLLFVFFFSHLLGRSVRQLRDAARRIANGNINERLVFSTNINEVHDMAVALEYMRGKLVAREQEVALYAARQSAVLETADEGIITLDEQCRIQSLNPAAENIFGYRKEELLGTPLSRLFIPSEIERFISPGGQPIPLSHQELTGLRKSGEIFFLLLSISEGNVSNTRFFTVMARDNSDRHIFESELEYMATHDILTGLPNRTLLHDRLQQAITQCARAKKLAAILFIDLDRFKIINDTLGHAAGDIVLRGVAERLRGCLREGDSVGRNGGDEFTVVLPMLNDPGDAAAIAQKVLATLVQPFMLDAGELLEGHPNEEVFIGGSIGISLYPGDGIYADSLLKNADTAMYQAKAAGGNTYCFHTANILSI
jgi:diguanylate cyclase (GGDEF)-like protein/PAS domain S-box-containing protein